MARIGLAMGLLLCVAQIRAAEPESDDAALARIKEEIVKMIGSARCRNLVHCRLLPLGLDACGVPGDYLAYSSAFTDIPALETKASEYAFLHEEIMSKRPAGAGECRKRPEPQAGCIDNHCRVLPAPQ